MTGHISSYGVINWVLLSSLWISAVAFLQPRPSNLVFSSSSAIVMFPQKMPPLGVMTEREADLLEMAVGGQRYEMVPLPDRMMDTTLYVGNLCEFVHDEDLSKLFQIVSKLQSVPSVVVRKADSTSLRYGFVSFLTVEEKEMAILRFHGMEWRGKRIKVEAIRDDPTLNRVKVPESIVTYVSGAAKKTRNGKVNSMRRNGRDAYGTAGMRNKKKKHAKKKLKANKRNAASKLTAPEKQELERASRKGFVTLDGRAQGHRSLATLCTSEALKASRVVTAHREWCDDREKPNIILYKASGRQSTTVLDHVVVDLSPLRLSSSSGQFHDDNYGGVANDLVNKWKSDILNAAASAGMTLEATGDSEECSTYNFDEVEGAANSGEFSINVNGIYSKEGDTSGKPISKLPIVSLGYFVGERTNAKAMARELATLWDVPHEEEAVMVEPATKPGKKTHKKTAPYTQERKRTERRRQRDDLQSLLNRYS